MPKYHKMFGNFNENGDVVFKSKVKKKVKESKDAVTVTKDVTLKKVDGEVKLLQKVKCPDCDAVLVKTRMQEMYSHQWYTVWRCACG